MAKNLRVHELAKELGLTNKEAVDLCLNMGIDIKGHSSSIIEAQADRVRRRAERDGLVRDVQPEEVKPVKKAAVKKVVQKLKIESYQSEVLPEDKFNFIKKLQAEQKITLMIGDGVNDAAALQQSDLSISLQSGNKIAISSSQIILMKNQLKVIPQLFQLSNLSQRIIRSNLFWAFLYNGLGIPVAMGLFSHLGFTLNPMWAGAAMTFSSISVVLNSLRIKLYKI